MTNVELVLFFGPPFTGKTSYYYKHYAKTHHRIAASDMYENDASHNLRTVILNAIDFLVKGKNVVVDDENWYNATRKSYKTLVEKRVDNCKLCIVQFLPEVTFGYEQCLWMREWSMVEWTMFDKGHKKRFKKISRTDEKLDCWFSKHRSVASTMNPPEFPALTNAFSLITTRPDFVCNTSYKFSLPALFIQWEAIVDCDTSNLNCKDGTVQFLNEWMNKNHCGRILLVGSKLKNDHEIFDEKVKLQLSNLSSQISYPIYFTFVDVKHQPDKFCKFPRPGIIAFLQKFHTIKLDHKSTVYVYMTDDHFKAASSVGIRTIKVGKLLANPKMVSAIFCGEASESLPFLKNLQEIHFDASKNGADSTSGETSGCGESNGAIIPFLKRARESSCNLVWKYCYGKLNGVSFKDKLILERYQSQYALAAQSSLSPEKFTEKISACSSTNVNRGQDTTNTRASENGGFKKDDIRDFTLENVTLEDVAETPGRYRAGIISKEKIYNFDTQLFANQLKITSNCLGSSDVSYDVHAFLSKSIGVASAQCSCPDSAGKVGRCKHVIGLLLYYQDRYEEILTASSTQQKKRSLSNTETSESDTRDSQSENTTYIMSVEELVETAQEILSKNYSSQQPQNQNQQQHIQENATQPFNDNKSLNSLQEITCSPERGIKRTRTPDDLEELLFGEFEVKKVERKKKCPDNLPSFAEETPPEEQPSMIRHNAVATVIIPDSLVPETVSLVPETIQSASTESLSRDASFTSPRNDSGNTPNLKTKSSFEDFLDEIL